MIAEQDAMVVDITMEESYKSSSGSESPPLSPSVPTNDDKTYCASA